MQLHKLYFITSIYLGIFPLLRSNTIPLFNVIFMHCTAAQDFTETQRTLIIPARSVATDRTCFNLSSVVINNDEVVEMTETFTLSLSSSSTSVGFGSATVQGSITDEDGKYICRTRIAN